MLILSGIAIVTLTGNNGLITQANRAKEEMEQTTEDELRKLTALEATTNFKNTTYIDNSMGEEKTITIPVGFAVSQVEGENTLKDGLVIIDTNGNEFVWIPVYTTFLADEGTVAEDEADFVTSVNKNHGFFISRYEIGNEGGKLISTEKDMTDTWTGWQNGKAVSKRNERPWNYITRDKALEIAKNMYSEKNGIKSRLLSNNAYDSVLEFIEKTDSNTEDSIKWGNYKASEILFSEFQNGAKYSIDGGINYQDITQDKKSGEAWLLTTGSTDRNKVKNIYDISGNVMTFTSYSKNGNAFARGSYYNSDKSELPVSNRYEYSTNNAFNNLGFRTILYLY